MPKDGQHKNDSHDYDKSRGPNNPDKSVAITTGTPKNRETYTQQANQGDDPGKQAQASNRDWNKDTRGQTSNPGSPRGRKGDLTENQESKAYFPGGSREPENPPRHPGASETPGHQVLPGDQHPEEWRDDMNPDRMKGQVGVATAQSEKQVRTAYDIKDLHDRLNGFPDDILKQIPVLTPGMRLRQGTVYVDLNDPDAREIRATGDMMATADNYYVPKSEVDHFTWNRLLDIRTPERVGDPGETTT